MGAARPRRRNARRHRALRVPARQPGIRPSMDRRAGAARPARRMTDRLFFALWPDTSLRQELERRLPPLTARVEGRPQRPDQWHVTLEFLGAVPTERQPALWAAADRVAMDP